MSKHPSKKLSFIFFLAFSLNVDVALSGSDPLPKSLTLRPKQAERLSEILLREGALPATTEWDLPSLLLSRQSLYSNQALELTQLKTALALRPGSTPQYLLNWINTWQITGRQILPSQNAYTMAAKPALDPVLQANDRIFLSERPRSVLFLGEDHSCEVEHAPLVSIQDQLKHCFPNPSWFRPGRNIDQVYIVYPNGKTVNAMVGNWNSKELYLLPPGTMVWAPFSDTSWTTQESLHLVKLLSYQISTQTLPALRATQQHSRLASPSAAQDAKLHNPTTKMPDLGVRPTRSDWGTVGLIQMPNARMAQTGMVSITAGRVEPYSRYSFIYQPTDWLEAGFRYSIITDRFFGFSAFSGDRKYQDKSVDVKFKLWDETAYSPQLALGFRDIGGTGLFSSEYFVASKAWGALDFSLGLGFGYMASAGGVANPFAVFNDKFDTRPAPDVGQGGQANSSGYFRGEATLFGGIEWQTPFRDLILKAELDGNNYQNEPLGNKQAQESRINLGLVYRINDFISLSATAERGNKLAFALSFEENISKYAMPKVSDPDPVEVTLGPRPEKVSWQQVLQEVQEQTTWNVSEVEQRGSEVRLTVKNSRITYPKKAADKASAVLHEHLPEHVRWFNYRYTNRGLNIADHVVDRGQWSKARTELAPDSKKPPETVAVQPNRQVYRPTYSDKEPWYWGGIDMGYQQTFGGANGYLFQFTVAAKGELRLAQNTWLQGRVDHLLGGTFDRFSQGSVSNLPQVRTRFREYSIASDTTMQNLQINHVGELSKNSYYSLYGGFLESMFGGVGVEYLYRPFNSPVAIGADLNRVRQRGFKQDFEFLDYQVNTGHLTAYIDTGFEDVLAKVSVGQYLAGDRGATVDLSRLFDNGVRIGAYATRTNVSAADFGEGSFDKGIYLHVPFDALFTSTISGSAGFKWVQVTRDGGAKLLRAVKLYDLTDKRSPRTLQYKPGDSN